MPRKQNSPHNPSRRVRRLARTAATVAQEPRRLAHVASQHAARRFAVCAPELRHLTRRTVETFVAEELFDVRFGELEGFATPGDPMVVIAARTAARR